MQLFSAVVIQVMSQYRLEFEGDAFKKRAREVTELLCDKERKQPKYELDKYDKLSTDKIAKLKAFTKDWIKKLLDRRRSVRPGPGSSRSSTAGEAGVGAKEQSEQE